MKRILIISCSVIVFVFLLYYLKEKYIWPSTPEPAVYLENIDTNWKSSFHINNPNSWKVEDGRVTFVGGSDTIGKLTLYSNEIPSENKKHGRMILKVTMSGDFDNINDSVIWGIQFGNKNTPDSLKLIMGVNGNAQPVKIIGNIKSNDLKSYVIKQKHVKIKNRKYYTKENCKDDIVLTHIAGKTSKRINFQLITANFINK